MHRYFYPQYDLGPLVWLAPFIVLDLVLKGIALWKSGRNNQLYWFVALLLINSLGILPAIYLIFFAKVEKRKG